MKKLLLYILTLIFTANNHAQQYIQRPDSLETIIETTSKDDTLRLSAIKELARIEQNTERGLELTQELLHEAERLKVNRYITFGAYYALIYYFNRQQIDSVKYYTDIILPIAHKEKIWVVYFDALKLRTFSYSMEENFELAIDEGLKMLKKAKDANFPDGIVSANTALATAYLATERWEEGLRHLKEAYKYLAEAKNILVSIDVVGMLISASFQEEDYEGLYQYLKEFEKNLSAYLEVAPFSDSFYSYYAFVEIYSGFYYIRTGKPDEALPHLIKAENLLQDRNSFVVYRVLYQEAMAEYYQTYKQYDKAISHLDTTLISLHGLLQNDYYKLLVKKADVYIKMEEYTQSLPLYKEAIAGKDSISQAVSNKQLNQIQQIYNIDRLYLEKEQLKTGKRSTILLLIVIGIIILATFIVRIIFVKKKLQESENEIRKASIIANEANEIKERFLSNMSYNIRTPLNSVVGFSQLLSAEPDMDEEQRNEYASIIQKNSDALMGLVNDILDLSRLESGMMKFNLGIHDMTSIYNDTIYTANKENDGLIHIKTDITNPKAEIQTDLSRFILLLASTLTYPIPCNEERKIILSIYTGQNDKEITFQILNSPLADSQFASQETTVRNEINRLFIEHFGGRYSINTENSLPPTIVFTYPLSIS